MQSLERDNADKDVNSSEMPSTTIIAGGGWTGTRDQSISTSHASTLWL